MLVDGLMGETPPAPEQLEELATQQAIAAVEAVRAECDAAAVIPLRKTYAGARSVLAKPDDEGRQGGY
jgi:hypothetical protein